MTAKKVFVVSVSIDFEMFVYADDESVAEREAYKHFEDEIGIGSITPFFSATEADDGLVYEDSVPWGEFGDEEELTVGEIIAARTKAKTLAEENSRIEANQLKLPLGGQS